MVQANQAQVARQEQQGMLQYLIQVDRKEQQKLLQLVVVKVEQEMHQVEQI